MKYQPLNDLIDPEVMPEDAVAPEGAEGDPGAPNDAYLIGDVGDTVQAPDAKPAMRKKRRRKTWVKPVALLLTAACVGLTVWNLSHLVIGPPAPPKPTPFQVKQALYLGVMKIEAFRRIHGVTPDTVEEPGLSNPPYSYTRVSTTRYAVAIDSAGSRLEYDSSVPMERFFGSPQAMLMMGDSQ